MRVRIAETQDANEFFPFGHCRLARTGDPGCGVRVEALFARLVQLAPVTGLRHAASKLGAGLGGDLHFLHVLRTLRRGDGPEIRTPRLRSDIERLRGDRKLRGRQPIALEPSAKRNGEEADELECEVALDFLLSAALQVRERETWIARPARLYQLGFANADFRIGRLQPAVVDERNLDCVIDREWMGKNLADCLLDGVGIGLRARPARLGSRALLGHGSHGREATIGRQRGAAADRKCSEDSDE